MINIKNMLNERRVTQESAYFVVPFMLTLQQATQICVEKNIWQLPQRQWR